MWFKKAQQINQDNIEQLDPFTPRQNIPSNGALEIKLIGSNFFMGPNDPPKLVQVQNDKGQQTSIILLHGTPDNMLTFPDDSGNLIAGDMEQFNAWRAKSGWASYGWVACNGGNLVSSSGADTLINAAGNVYVGTYNDQDGNTVLQFTQ